MTVEVPTTTWAIDPVHSSVNFAVQHLGISTYRGRFRAVAGSIRLDESEPERSSVTAEIQVASMDATNDQLQQHVLAADFLDAERYPTITFRSTRAERLDDRHWNIYGDLTIRGVTNTAMLATLYHGRQVHPFTQKPVAAFSATTAINRKGFGLVWEAPLANGGAVLGERVQITIEIEAVRAE